MTYQPTDGDKARSQCARESGKPGPRSDRIPPDQNATERRHPLDALNCANPPGWRLSRRGHPLSAEDPHCPSAQDCPCPPRRDLPPGVNQRQQSGFNPAQASSPAPALYLSGSASRSRSTQALPLPRRSTADPLDFKSDSSAATLRFHPTSTNHQPPTPSPAQAHRWPFAQQCYRNRPSCSSNTVSARWRIAQVTRARPKGHRGRVCPRWQTITQGPAGLYIKRIVYT